VVIFFVCVSVFHKKNFCFFCFFFYRCIPLKLHVLISVHKGRDSGVFLLALKDTAYYEEEKEQNRLLLKCELWPVAIRDAYVCGSTHLGHASEIVSTKDTVHAWSVLGTCAYQPIISADN
jgi:hypothetical protein